MTAVNGLLLMQMLREGLSDKVTLSINLMKGWRELVTSPHC